MVKNPPSNAGDTGSIPGQRTKIPHATGQLSPRTATTEPVRHNYREACVPQIQNPRSLEPHTTTGEPACNNY